MGNLSDTRQYLERYILLWLNNDQATHEMCTGAAMDAATLAAKDDVNAPDHVIHHAAGEAVADMLTEWIEEIRAYCSAQGMPHRDGPGPTMLGLLKDLLDVGDSQLWTSIGESFLSDWERPVKCRASDCDEVATEDDGHCDDCVNLVADGAECLHDAVAGIMVVHDEDLESVAAVRRVTCHHCDWIYVAGLGWRPVAS